MGIDQEDFSGLKPPAALPDGQELAARIRLEGLGDHFARDAHGKILTADFGAARGRHLLDQGPVRACIATP